MDSGFFVSPLIVLFALLWFFVCLVFVFLVWVFSFLFVVVVIVVVVFFGGVFF